MTEVDVEVVIVGAGITRDRMPFNLSVEDWNTVIAWTCHLRRGGLLRPQEVTG